MLALVTDRLRRAWPLIVAAAGVALLVLAYIVGGRQATEQVKRKQAERRADLLKKKVEVKESTNALDRDELRDRTREWMRKD